jgi:hypothetical protein
VSEGDPAATAARRSRLNAVKLRALVVDHLADTDVPAAEPFGPGAALVHDDAAWVYLDDRPEARLGAALARATRAQVSSLHVIAESGTGVLARRAPEFSLPIAVWHAEGRRLWQAVAEPSEYSAEPPIHHRQWRQTIADAGADPVEEYGVLAGEVRGLEVCRVVDDPDTGSTRLAVGIGAHDREAFAMLHGDEPASEALARVADVIRPHRSLEAPPHPLNRLARERLLRWLAVEQPARVGASRLEPVPPPVPRVDLKQPVPCVAMGVDDLGRAVVAVFSTGADLDVIPFAADARLGCDGDARLLVVTPHRDRLKVTRDLAAALRRPADLVSFD